MRRTSQLSILAGATATLLLAAGLASAGSAAMATPQPDPNRAECEGQSTPRRVDAPSLPWPVVLQTSCARYVIFRDGAVAALPLPLDPGWNHRVSTGRGGWAEVQDGRVMFERGGATIWRSVRRDYDPDSLESAVAGPGWVAFSIYSMDGGFSDLLVGIGTGSERSIARDEEPLAADPNGNLILSPWAADGSAPDLVVRAPGGTLLRVLARGVQTAYPEASNGTILYLAGGAVWRTDGLQVRRVSGTADLGAGTFVQLSPSADRPVVPGPLAPHAPG